MYTSRPGPDYEKVITITMQVQLHDLYYDYSSFVVIMITIRLLTTTKKTPTITQNYFTSNTHFKKSLSEVSTSQPEHLLNITTPLVHQWLVWLASVGTIFVFAVDLVDLNVMVDYGHHYDYPDFKIVVYDYNYGKNSNDYHWSWFHDYNLNRTQYWYTHITHWRLWCLPIYVILKDYFNSG